MNSFRRISAIAFLGLGLSAPAYGQRVPSRLPRDDGWVDATKHKAGFITVQRNVRLHYLDFGGTGPALVLLPGIGNTAHAYDAFASGLTDRFHVYALTRRGFGESSHPSTGYDMGRLVEDIRVAFLSTADYRESNRNTTATTVKYSFNSAPFISLLESP